MVRAYVAAAGIAAALAGCSQSGETSAPPSGASPAAPKAPAYAPLYPGAVLESSAEANGSNASATVTFHTADKPADVIAFYRRTAQAAGLDSTFSSQSGEDLLFSAGRKGGEEGVQVISTPADGGASVQLFWTGPKRR